MPFDGSGNYTPPGSPVFPAVTNTTISSSYFNQIINDVAAALSNTLTKDGQGKPTTSYSWNNQALTGVQGLDTLYATGGYNIRVRQGTSTNATIQFVNPAASSQLGILVHDGTNFGIYASVGNLLTTTMPTADNSTAVATTAFVQSNIVTLSNAITATFLTISGAAATYLTIGNASTTYLSQTAAASTYLTQAAAASTYAVASTVASTYAPLASPTFTGTPAGPTATAGTNTTQLATTAFVTAAIAAIPGPVTQTVTDETGSRTSNINYTNSTSAKIQCIVTIQSYATIDYAGTLTIDGVTVSSSFIGGNYDNHFDHVITFDVPAGKVYNLNTAGAGAIVKWIEIR